MKRIDAPSRIFGARRSGGVLPEFPGRLPANIDDAYLIQDKIIDLDDGKIGGWKIGTVPAGYETGFGNRFVGPILERNIHVIDGSESLELTMNPQWFCALEAEFCLRLSRDLPARDDVYGMAEVLSAIESVNIGLEILGSPMPDILDLGPGAIISDLGLNWGTVIGRQIDDWANRLTENSRVDMFIDGDLAESGGVASIANGIGGALVFHVNELIRRKRIARAGEWILTGACCGLHRITMRCEMAAEFIDIGGIRIRVGNNRFVVDDMPVLA